MGLSKIGPANQQHTVLFTNVVGTPGYCDPQYMVTYALTKESDVYSFGVVLFEVLCGRLCFKWSNNHLEILVPMWKQSYIHKKLDQIIFKDLMPSLDPTSLRTFSDIAFQFLHDSREQRPTMSLLVKTLETALKFQERHELNLDNAMGTSQSQTYLNVLFSKGKGLFLGKKKREAAIQKDAEGVDAKKAEGKLVHFDATLIFTADELFGGSGESMGRSTYGTYYKGTLENGKHVAVNKLGGNFTKNQKKFEVELKLLAKIKHPNLWAMAAYYLHPEGEKLLIYEYMPKGSIATFLHAIGPKQQINWATRMQIAKGVARGLHSLHTHYNIIHGNITSSNVFLDKNINPKISDFGLSELITPAANSNAILTAGILGYQAPEIYMLEKADSKTDIYSLGVVMLELLTGKSPGKIKDQDLPQWVRSIRQQEWMSEVFDIEIVGYTSHDEEEMLNVLQLAMDCVSKSPLRRPDVQLVLQQLEKIR